MTCLEFVTADKYPQGASIIVVVGFFWSPVFANVQVYSIPSSNGDYVQQTVSIDNENKIAIIHVYGGLCSSDTIFDYKHGYIASRLFSRRACFVMKMERGYIPELEEIGRLAYEKQMMNQMLSPKNMWVKYEPSNSFFGEMREWLVFGSSIEHLCRDVPVYKVERTERGIHAGGCAKAGLLGILGISICGDINL
ncbi:gastrokine-2 [Elgaria multicarinata webbii]|uniref:gastrokine-2 n=1 Tax=Elgaria multicarinata webbii TaxID=159646 RepID=UPI002FCCBF3B